MWSYVVNMWSPRRRDFSCFGTTLYVLYYFRPRCVLHVSLTRHRCSLFGCRPWGIYAVDTSSGQHRGRGPTTATRPPTFSSLSLSKLSLNCKPTALKVTLHHGPSWTSWNIEVLIGENTDFHSFFVIYSIRLWQFSSRAKRDWTATPGISSYFINVQTTVLVRSFTFQWCKTRLESDTRHVIILS